MQLGYVDERRQLRILTMKLFDLIEQGQHRCRGDSGYGVHVGSAESDVSAYHSLMQYATVGAAPRSEALGAMAVHHFRRPGVARSAISRSLFASMFMLRVLLNNDGD